MTKSHRILVALAAIPGACLFHQFAFAADRAASRPNILIILADDLGYGDVACYNATHGKIRTPHLDQFAAEGVRFTDAHSSSAVCSPSRYSLLTGRYHWRSRLQSGIVNKFGPPMIDPDRATLPKLLQQQGYRTACFGKWHLGWNWPIPADRKEEFLADPRDTSNPPTENIRALWKSVFSQPASGGPVDCGFDSFFGVDLPNFPPFCFIEGNRTVGQPDTVLAPTQITKNLADFSRPAINGWDLEPVLPTITERACRFIRESARSTQPYFLYLPLTAPHTPLSVSKQWQGKSGLNNYADYVMQTDAMIGQVLETVDGASGAENTLVIITSDNGCAPYVGTEELAAKGHYPNWPYRGFKTDIWEGGHRVPFIVRWKGRVGAGQVCDGLVQQVDTVSTIAEILDIELPPNFGEDSFSYWPLLSGKQTGLRTLSVNQSIKGLLAIRRGPWKLIFGQGSGGWAKGSDTEGQQLYNVDEDPEELHNVLDSYPKLVLELTAQMEDVVARGRSTPGPDQKNDVHVDWRRFIGVAAN